MSSPADPSAQLESHTPWEHVRRRAVRGSLWWLGTYPVTKVIQMATSVLLARWLSPAAFGVAAIATTVTRGIQMISEVGVSLALVQQERTDEAFVNTGWTMQVARGCIVCLLALAISAPVAAFYGTPELRPMICVLGIGAVLVSLQSTKYALLNRHLNERPRALLELAAGLTGRALTVALAFVWPTAWSLVLGGIAASVFLTVASHLLPGPRNRLCWDKAAAKSLFQFGGWFLVGTIAAYLGGQLDALVLGHLLSASLEALGVVGVYELTKRVVQIPVELIGVVTDKMVLATLSDVWRRDRHALPMRVRQMRVVVLPAALALCLGVSVVAPWFFELLYDTRYASATWMAPLMSLGSWMFVIGGLATRVLLAQGRTRVLAGTSCLAAAAIVLASIVGFLVAGLPGFLLGLPIGSLLRYLVDTHFLRKTGVLLGRLDALYTLAFVGCGTALVFVRELARSTIPGVAGDLVGGLVPLGASLAVLLWATRRALRFIRR